MLNSNDVLEKVQSLPNTLPAIIMYKDDYGFQMAGPVVKIEVISNEKLMKDFGLQFDGEGQVLLLSTYQR